MKNWKILGFIVFLVMVGFGLVSCDNGSSNGDTSLIPNVTTQRYVISSYQSNDMYDRIKYSYTYDEYDFYYIYLGQMSNIPIYSYKTESFNGGYDWTYTVTVTESVTDSIGGVVTESSKNVESIVNENTYSTNNTQKVSAEASASFKLGAIKAETKASAEATWNQFTENKETSSFERTTSFENTISHASSYTKQTLESNTYHLSKDAAQGYYRYALFMTSDVYLFVVKNRSNDEIEFEFREHIIPESYFWSFDYSPTPPPFEKTGNERFNIDISILNNLPSPKWKLSDIEIPEKLFGTGTVLDPFLVKTVDDLLKVGTGAKHTGGDWMIDKHYIQTANIILPGGNMIWTPIGGTFTGSYDGGGHTITGLKINATVNNVGMFSVIGTGGEVKNLGLVDVNVTGYAYVGGIAGVNNGTVQNCFVTGSVSGTGNVGGVVGAMDNGDMQNCFVIGLSSSISGSHNIGGVIGFANESRMRNCYSSSNVTGSDDNIGGIAGANTGEIINCYATGNINGSNRVGGVVGWNYTGSSNVENCVALNYEIEATNGKSGRIVGGTEGVGSFPAGNKHFNNYSRSNMIVLSSSITNVINGIDIISASWTNSNWWKTEAKFDIDNIWQFRADGLPILRNMPQGTQNPQIQN